MYKSIMCMFVVATMPFTKGFAQSMKAYEPEKNLFLGKEVTTKSSKTAVVSSLDVKLELELHNLTFIPEGLGDLSINLPQLSEYKSLPDSKKNMIGSRAMMLVQTVSSKTQKESKKVLDLAYRKHAPSIKHLWPNFCGAVFQDPQTNDIYFALVESGRISDTSPTEFRAKVALHKVSKSGALTDYPIDFEKPLKDWPIGSKPVKSFNVLLGDFRKTNQSQFIRAISISLEHGEIKITGTSDINKQINLGTHPAVSNSGSKK
ncbi:hypothetical protein BVX99_02855 [bacterium F16]|nr:hypothetical protein BVX99_02855 [bacterium F16]